MTTGLHKLASLLPEPITRRLPTAFKSKLALRAGGDSSEITFWRNWFETEGGIFHDNYILRTNRARRRETYPSYLDPLIEELPNRFPGERLEVLDLGSGPISLLAWGHESGLFELTCIDVLAREYLQLLDEFEIDIQIPIHAACGEDLDYDSHFHLVYTSNALDHCGDPALVFANLVRAVKPGGYILIASAVQEGTNNNWGGGHHHDLDLVDDQITLTNRHGATSILTQDAGLKPVWSQTSPPGDLDCGYFEIAYEKN